MTPEGPERLVTGRYRWLSSHPLDSGSPFIASPSVIQSLMQGYFARWIPIAELLGNKSFLGLVYGSLISRSRARRTLPPTRESG